MNVVSPGTVYLVGAGPGDPGLLTQRALEILAAADEVIHDKLVSRRILATLRPEINCRCVSDLPGKHPEHLPHINAELVKLARAGRVVVRLKGGDSMIFGRVGEETAYLRAAGVPYEIVPGVTSASAAGAYAEIPLTHRGSASAVALVTGHENPFKPQSDLDWSALARFPGTLVLYMAVARVAPVVQVLQDNGKPSDTPVAVVEYASRGEQRTVRCTLGSLIDTIRDEALQAPAIIVIGAVNDLKPAVSWFESRPLYNRRVLVTRPRHQAGDLLRTLEHLGAVPYLLPTVEISPPADWTPVDTAIARLGDYDWLVFTSTNGVDAFMGRLRQQGRDVRALAGVRIAAIGPATTRRLRDFHLEPDLVPTAYASEQLAAELLPVAKGTRVLLARADRGSDVLREVLGPVAEVEQIVVYRQTDAITPDAPAWEVARLGSIEFVILTSSNIARAFLQMADGVVHHRIRAGTTRLVTISPKTSAAVRELGFEVAGEASDATTEGVVAALIALAQEPTPAA